MTNPTRRALATAPLALAAAAAVPAVAAAAHAHHDPDANLDYEMEPDAEAEHPLVTTLDGLGGERGLPMRSINIRIGDLDGPLRNEVIAAAEEARMHEITYDLYTQARNGRNYADAISYVSFKALAGAILAQIKELGGEGRVIVSPSALTVLQAQGDLRRIELPAGRIIATHPVGEIVDGDIIVPVFIDQYARDSEPLIVATNDWFHYEFGGGHATTPNEDGTKTMTTDAHVFPKKDSYRLIGFSTT